MHNFSLIKQKPETYVDTFLGVNPAPGVWLFIYLLRSCRGTSSDTSIPGALPVFTFYSIGNQGNRDTPECSHIASFCLR